MFTVKQAAERLGCSVDLVYRLCSLRKLSHVRIGLGRGRIKIREQDIEAFISGALVWQEDPAGPKAPPVTLKHIHL